MKIILSCCTLLLVVLLQFSCNPSCEPLVGLEVMPATGVSGTEVLLRATPLESLIDQDLEIRFGSKPVIEKRFHPQLGLVITIPEGVSGNTDLVVSTPDCQERLNFNAVTEAFLKPIKVLFPRLYLSYLSLLPHCPLFLLLWKMPGCTRSRPTIVSGLSFLKILPENALLR